MALESKYWHLVIALGLAVMAVRPAMAADLSLETYLSQVREKHDGLKSTTLLAQAAETKAPESALPLAWTLTSSVEQRYDHQTPLTLFFLQNNSTSYSLGISKLTTFGLQAKWTTFAKQYTYVNLPASYASIIPFNSYWDISSGFEFTQSLWKNFFGRSTRAQRDLEEATALAEHHKNNYSLLQLLAQAQTAYWNASAAQEIVHIQEDTLERSAQLVAWCKQRTKLDLADKSDLYQAEANFKIRELELLQGQSELKTAARALNSLRGVDSDQITESLLSVRLDQLEKTAAPARAKFRQDVLAAEQAARAAHSNAQLGLEKNKPALEAYANFYLNGRDPNGNSALSLLSNGKYNLTVFGVRLSTPLEFGLLSDDKEAYVKEQKAAELNLARKRFEQDSDWQELSRRLEEAKTKLRLARDIVKAQEQKFRFEQDRLRRGKTTLFQVLQFEADLATALQLRIQRENEVRNVLNQMNTFGGNS